MEYGSFDPGEDGDYNGVGYVEISGIFVMHFAFIWLERRHLTELYVHMMRGIRARRMSGSSQACGLHTTPPHTHHRNVTWLFLLTSSPCLFSHLEALDGEITRCEITHHTSKYS